MKRFFYFLIILFCFSCKEKENFITEQIQLSEPKQLEIIKTTRIPAKCYSQIIMLDTLIMMTTACDYHCFSIYNKFTHEFITSFLDHGQKEFDFDFPSLYLSIDYDSQKILCYDINSLKNAEINVDSILHGVNPYTQIKYSKKDKELFATVNLSYISENKIIGFEVVHVNRGMFFIYDTHTKEKKWIDYSPKFEYEDKQILYEVYYNLTVANQDKQTIAVAFRYIDMVCFYDFNGILKKRVCFSDLRQPETMKNVPIIAHDEKLFFISTFATSKYYYAMKYNMSPIDISKNKAINPVIIKFDWDGNFICNYTFDRGINAFCIDENRMRIYIVASTENPEYEELIELKM
jgi:hypothetical protein